MPFNEDVTELALRVVRTPSEWPGDRRGLFVGRCAIAIHPRPACRSGMPLFMGGLLEHRSRPGADARVAADEFTTRWNWRASTTAIISGDPWAAAERLVVDAAAPRYPSGRTAAIFLLTGTCGILGYGFNPVSFFYCFSMPQRLQPSRRGQQHLAAVAQYWPAADSGSRNVFASIGPPVASTSPSRSCRTDLGYTSPSRQPPHASCAHMKRSRRARVSFDATPVAPSENRGRRAGNPDDPSLDTRR